MKTIELKKIILLEIINNKIKLVIINLNLIQNPKLEFYFCVSNWKKYILILVTGLFWL